MCKLNTKTIKDIYELNRKFTEIKKLKYIKGINNNKNASGLTFEKLLNSTSGDFCIPDYKSIEIKVLRDYELASINLFTSSPDGNIPSAIKWVAQEYGTTIKYNNNINYLICKLSGIKAVKISSNYKAKLKINYDNCKVILEIYDVNNKLINNNIYWDFNTLEEKLKRKLSYLAIITSRKKIIDSNNYYEYTNIKYYKLKSFSTFLNLLDNGIVTLNIKTGLYKSGPYKGKFHDHGVSFCISKKDIDRLFLKIEL